jgi:uncharacterized protein (DUF2342 family)
MGQTTDQIESHIEDKREDLQTNLRELEHKVKAATDWRQYFRTYTGTMLAAAFGGGAMISSALGKSKSATGPQEPVPAGAKSRVVTQTSHAGNEVLETWDTIKTALVGVAATKFKGMLSEVVPGFTEHLAKSEARRRGTGRPAETIIED